MKVKSQKQAQEPSCHTLPPAASIFHESEYATDEECQSDHENFDNDKCKDNYGVQDLLMKIETVYIIVKHP